MTNTELEQQRQAIGNAQAAVLDKIAGQTFSAVRRFRTIPSMAMVADERTLAALVALAEVARVNVDRLDVPQLTNSTRVIGSDNVRDALGSAGAGTAAAILDTGVDKNHPFLAGRVVAEACFSGPNLHASWQRGRRLRRRGRQCQHHVDPDGLVLLGKRLHELRARAATRPPPSLRARSITSVCGRAIRTSAPPIPTSCRGRRRDEPRGTARRR